MASPRRRRAKPRLSPVRSPRKKSGAKKSGAAISTRRQHERDRARGRILTAGTHLFATKGIENVTFGDIARRARMSRPLVYFYFPDLRSLFLETAHHACAQLHDRLNKAVASSQNGLDAIVSLGRSYVDFHETEPELFYLSMVSTNSPRPNGRRTSTMEEQILTMERSMMKLVEESVTRGVKDGSLRQDIGNPLVVALSLWAFVQGLVQLSTGHQDTIERFFGVGQKRFLDAGFATLRGALTSPH